MSGERTDRTRRRTSSRKIHESQRDEERKRTYPPTEIRKLRAYDSGTVTLRTPGRRVLDDTDTSMSLPL